MAALIPLAIKWSLILIVFAVGLQSTFRNASCLFRQPRQLLSLVVAMNVVMPLLVVALVPLFHVGVTLVALLTLAVSPVPPFLPNKAINAGGDANYTIGLLAATCLLAVVTVPLAVKVGELMLGRSSAVPAQRIVMQVLVGVLVPLLAGLLVRRWLPTLAQRTARPLSVAATVLLVVSFLPVLVQASGAMLALVGKGTVVAFALFAAIGLLVGHWLGGPHPDDRSVLALATACRHPGIAIALAHATFPEQKQVGPAVLVYLAVSGLICAPYLHWVKRRSASRAETEQHEREGSAHTG